MNKWAGRLGANIAAGVATELATDALVVGLPEGVDPYVKASFAVSLDKLVETRRESANRRRPAAPALPPKSAWMRQAEQDVLGQELPPTRRTTAPAEAPPPGEDARSALVEATLFQTGVALGKETVAMLRPELKAAVSVGLGASKGVVQTAGEWRRERHERREEQVMQADIAHVLGPSYRQTLVALKERADKRDNDAAVERILSPSYRQPLAPPALPDPRAPRPPRSAPQLRPRHPRPLRLRP